MKTPVTCACGRSIATEEITQIGAYLRLAGPNLIFVRFRCSVCTHTGEKLYEQHRWQKKLLDLASDNDPQDVMESGRFKIMGPIKADEQIDFHLAIRQMGSITL